MAQFGIGNFHVSFEVNDKSVTYKFWDPEDPENNMDVSIDKKDLPEGVQNPDERSVLDQAYAMAAQALNEQRDNRLKKEASEAAAAQVDADAKKRQAANEFLANSQDVQTQPAKVESDGTNVFNVPSSDSSNSDSSKKNK